MSLEEQVARVLDPLAWSDRRGSNRVQKQDLYRRAYGLKKARAVIPIVLEAAAKVIEEGQETDSNTVGKHLTPRMDGNLAGTAYATAIRSLIDKGDEG